MCQAFVDNIPFTATMVPVMIQMVEAVDGISIRPLAWALAFGACFGGNGTLIGASANIVMASKVATLWHPVPIRASPSSCLALAPWRQATVASLCACWPCLLRPPALRPRYIPLCTTFLFAFSLISCSLLANGAVEAIAQGTCCVLTYRACDATRCMCDMYTCAWYACG